MVKRSKADWRKLFAAHAKSGMTASAFCREHKLCPRYFSLRKKQLGAGFPKVVSPKDEVSDRPAFVPARIVRTSASIQIRAGSVSLEIPVEVSADWLVLVVKGLAV